MDASLFYFPVCSAARGGGRSLEVLYAETMSRAPSSGNMQHDHWHTEDPEPDLLQLQCQASAPLLTLKTRGRRRDGGVLLSTQLRL